MSPGTFPLMNLSSFLPSTLQGTHANKSGILLFLSTHHLYPYTVMSSFREARFPNTKIFPNNQPFQDLSPCSKFHPHPQPRLHLILPMSELLVPPTEGHASATKVANLAPQIQNFMRLIKMTEENFLSHRYNNGKRGLSSLRRKQSFQRKILSCWQDQDFNTEGV